MSALRILQPSTKLHNEAQRIRRGWQLAKNIFPTRREWKHSQFRIKRATCRRYSKEILAPSCYYVRLIGKRRNHSLKSRFSRTDWMFFYLLVFHRVSQKIICRMPFPPNPIPDIRGEANSSIPGTKPTYGRLLSSRVTRF